MTLGVKSFQKNPEKVMKSAPSDSDLSNRAKSGPVQALTKSLRSPYSQFTKIRLPLNRASAWRNLHLDSYGYVFPRSRGISRRGPDQLLRRLSGAIPPRRLDGAHSQGSCLLRGIPFLICIDLITGVPSASCPGNCNPLALSMNDVSASILEARLRQGWASVRSRIHPTRIHCYQFHIS